MALIKSMQLKVIAASCGCHVGKKRKNNEDNFYFNGKYLDSDNMGLGEILTKKTSLLEDVLGNYQFYAVFDGMGGGDYGEIASNIAAKTVKDFLQNEENINPADITPSLSHMCQIMNKNVFRTEMNLGASQMGSTLVSLFFYAGQVWVCNIGDSRCYRLRDGQMEQISMDHTDEAEMKAFGIKGRKPYLTQFLGVDPEEILLEPHVKSYRLEEGDTFLLCSDGLTDMVTEQEICNMLDRYENTENCVCHLIDAALEAGGRDNITVIVCQAG